MTRMFLFNKIILELLSACDGRRSREDKVKMEIKKELKDRTLILAESGIINAVTAPELQKAIEDSIDEVDDVILDFADVEYITSACLRVILYTEQMLSGRGRLVIKNINDMVNEVFEMTGLLGMLNIE